MNEEQRLMAWTDIITESGFTTKVANIMSEDSDDIVI